MVAPKNLSAGGANAHPAFRECEELSRQAGEGACRDVLLALCKREQEGEDTTVWDIHRLTGLPLHEAFAALRTLEYGKIVDIMDNPADPFGAVIRMRGSGLEKLRLQRAG